jgi:DNA-binding NtrC family response regulator
LSETFGGLLNQFKVGLVNQAVVDCHGNKTLAARRLGVSRAYLHRLLRRVPEQVQDASEGAA